MSPEARRKAFYALVWRWHFYAGLYVVPCFVMLALTGLVLLAKGPVERWQYGALVADSPGPSASHEARLRAAEAAMPDATFVRYEPGLDGAVTRVFVERRTHPFTIFVDPVTARVRGAVDGETGIASLADTMHGTFLVGNTGDRLIEIAAGLGVMLLASGLYLWFPGLSRVMTTFRIRRHPVRIAWRDLHAVTGVVLAPVLLFYLVSGLAWAGVWGEWFVQAWNTFPAAKAAPEGGGAHVHEALNGYGPKVVPWNLEQTLLPVSYVPDGHPSAAPERLSLDTAIAIAQDVGIGRNFWVGVPLGMDGVWTVAQTAMAANVADPRDEKTVHVDQYSGAVLGVVDWHDYGIGAKGMAAGIPLHMGYLGPWNIASAAATCLAVIVLAVSGVAMWWKRRPARAGRLVAPPVLPEVDIPAVTWVTLAVLAIGMPLFGATIVAVALADWLVLRHLPGLRARLS